MIEIVPAVETSPAPAPAPVHPLLERARRCGQALIDSNTQLWEFGRSVDPPDLRGRAMENILAENPMKWHEPRYPGQVPRLDQKGLEDGVDRILGQLGLVWDLGQAGIALYEAPSGERDDLVDALESEWPPSYLRFAMAMARAFRREAIAGQDLDLAALAVLARVPLWITDQMMDCVRRHDYDRAADLLRHNPTPPAGYPEAGDVQVAFHNLTLELLPPSDKFVFRGLRSQRLWTWARIASAFQRYDVVRPGMDEGKLTTVLGTPRRVRRALMPQAPAMCHALLSRIGDVMRTHWEDELSELKSAIHPRMARQAIKMAQDKRPDPLSF